MDRNLRPPRRIPGLAIALVMTLTAAVGCAEDTANSSGKTVIRFSWWGSDDRHEATQKIIQRFEQKHPNIDVQPEYTNYYDYFDKLTTGAASDDLPDVMQTIDPYMYSYIDNDQLLDLRPLATVLPTNELDQESLSGMQVDGALYGIPSGMSSFGLYADPVVFEQAGVPLPDDDSWSWEEYKRIAVEIANSSPEVEGTQLPLDRIMMTVWIRQQGEALWNERGTDIGFTVETVTEFFEYVLELRDSGATPSAEEEIEQSSSGSLEQSRLALGKGGMQLASVNQLADLEEVAGREIKLLLFPGEKQAKVPGSTVEAGGYYSIAANSEHPKQAAMLIDYLVNSVEPAKIQGLDRGVPVNDRVLRAIEGDLTSPERRFVDFIERVERLNAPPMRPGNPEASLAIDDAAARLTENVLFNRQTPREAAEQLVAELRTEA